jgi:hypothetical protein
VFHGVVVAITDLANGLAFKKTCVQVDMDTEGQFVDSFCAYRWWL